LRFIVFCRDWCSSQPAGKGREGESRADPPVSGISGGAWLHAPPGMVARWNMRRQLFLSPIPVQKGSFAIPGVLGD